MKFESKHIRGAGRGRGLGFPTINLMIPVNFSLTPGIYAVWINLGDQKYPGALHYGGVPSFGEQKLSLEVHILDDKYTSSQSLIEGIVRVEVVSRLRDVMSFRDLESLKAQIAKDVLQARGVLG